MNTPISITDIRQEFPIFEHNQDLVYLDSAASTQKPRSVIAAETEFYSKSYANVHRGIYALSEQATAAYESARDKIARFIKAEREEIILTSGTTDSINSVAQSLELSKMLSDRPQIALSELEHHANILPWQKIAHRMPLTYLPVTSDFTLDIQGVRNNTNVDVLALTHISNVTGTLNDPVAIRSKLPCKYLVLDAAQSIAHMPIDTSDWAADFVAFSGHKLHGPTGIGVLYGKKSILEQMEPARRGGGMITEVRREDADWADIPTRFEAGTPPIAQAIGLSKAIEFISAIGWEAIQAHEQALHDYALSELNTIPYITIFHPQQSDSQAGVISFSIAGIHAHDLSQVLAEQNIAVRAGHHCTHVLHREVLKVASTTRISFGVYNQLSDIDRLITGIKSAIKILT